MVIKIHILGKDHWEVRMGSMVSSQSANNIWSKLMDIRGSFLNRHSYWLLHLESARFASRNLYNTIHAIILLLLPFWGRWGLVELNFVLNCSDVWSIQWALYHCKGNYFCKISLSGCVRLIGNFCSLFFPLSSSTLCWTNFTIFLFTRV